MYKRQMLVMLSLICLCMILLGSGFFLLSYRYHQDELRARVSRDISCISSYTNSAVSSGVALSSEYSLSYIASVSNITGDTIILCAEDGRVLYAVGEGLQEDAVGSVVPSWAVREVLLNMTFDGRTSFNGMLNMECFVSGVPVVSYVINPVTRETLETPIGILFVASDASSLEEFTDSTVRLFLMTALVVLLVSLMICSVMVQRMIDPLRSMCALAYRFAHGEVDIRFTDYTGRKDEIGELAVAFNAMAESLAQAEQKRSEFVANVSHELKTPMTTIAGFADGILDGTIPPEKERESLEVISSETRRLSRLVRRMLELSRLQSSERVAAQEQFDAAEVLLRVLVSLEAKITEKDLDVQADLPDGPMMVWGDPDAVTQVCYNLLDNAVKFAAPRGRLVLKMTAKGGKVITSVGNDGETIPQEQLDHIFDRFHKADSSRSAHRDGVGLGLYIVKTLLNTYKEDISVTSQEGYTEFTFTLSEV